MKIVITIGIPLRNEEESIVKCLKAILHSNLPEKTEIIICDNNSTDNSLLCIKKIKDKRIKLIKESKLGKVFVMNKIIKEASSDYIMFCDADVLVKYDTITKTYEKLKTSDLHIVGIGLLDISKNKFFKWYYRELAKVQKDDIDSNVMGGFFGINKKKFVKFPPILSTDFFMSAYYYFGNKKALRFDSIGAYYKRANTVGDILMKKTRNRLKYLQIKNDFPNLSKFQYEPTIDYKKLLKNFSSDTFLAFLLYFSFETIAFIVGTIFFYVKLKKVGYSWRKAKSTKLGDIDISHLNLNLEDEIQI